MAPAVIGIDGYPRGWIAARLVDGTLSWAVAGVDGVAGLWADGDVVGIDIPVGLVDSGLRECDRAAQAHLGRAASTVFTTPPRPVLTAHLAADATRERTQELSRRLTGQGTTPFALALARRIMAVDAAAAHNPLVVEVHPECAFRAMTPRTDLEPKSSARGVIQRMAALSTWIPDIHGLLEEAPERVPIEDALDALAALWSARRWLDGTASTLPEGATARPFIAF